MKLRELRSLGHNIAHSFASGASHLTGIYGYDVFREVRDAENGTITVDFVSGAYSGVGRRSRLPKVLKAFVYVLPKLSKRHNISIRDVGSITAQYSGSGMERLFKVTVTARDGRSATNFYKGYSGTRVRTLDDKGRIRRAASV